MFAWLTKNPELALNVVVALAAALGAVLPAASPVGQWLRRWFPDVAGKNTKLEAK